MNDIDYPENSKWTIDWDKETDRITIYCNRRPVAWGTEYYMDDMVNTFLKYQYATGKPKCDFCGHSLFVHLQPCGISIEQYVPSCTCNRWIHTGCPAKHDGCNWGGGLEGWCNCEGYKSTQFNPNPPTFSILENIKRCLSREKRVILENESKPLKLKTENGYLKLRDTIYRLVSRIL